MFDDVRAYTAPEARKWPTTPAVYAIRCAPNGRVYIGSTINLRRRIAAALNSLHKGRAWNNSLQQDWERFGAGAFSFYMLERVTDQREARNVERHWMDTLDWSTLYNVKRKPTWTPQGKGSRRGAQGFDMRLRKNKRDSDAA